jgi:hypothetical protein
MRKELLTKSLLAFSLSIITVIVLIGLYLPAATVSAQTGETPGALTIVMKRGTERHCVLSNTRT